VNIDLARSILLGILALDLPIGQLMEIVKSMEEGAARTQLKDCCAILLRAQFNLIEQILDAYPRLREEIDSERSRG
jgi:hypothetical protein